MSLPRTTAGMECCNPMADATTLFTFGKTRLAGGVGLRRHAPGPGRVQLHQTPHQTPHPAPLRDGPGGFARCVGRGDGVAPNAGFLGSALALSVTLLVHFGMVGLVADPRAALRKPPLFYQGKVLDKALEAVVGLSEEGVVRGLRALGVERNEQVAALVLEETGTLRLFYMDAQPPTLWKRSGESLPRGWRVG